MIYYGKPVSGGIAIASVCVYRPFCPTIVCEPIGKKDVPDMLKRYAQTKEKALAELADLEKSLSVNHSDKAAIITAQSDMLCDMVIESEIMRLVEEQLYNPDFAIDTVYSRFAEKFERSKSKVIQERGSDLMDIKKRLLRCWHDEPDIDLSNLKEPCVIVAEDLFPSDTVKLDRKNTVGIATEKGGTTCHTAIVARSYGIPAVLGIGCFIDSLKDGQTVIIDALEGKIITSPDDGDIEKYTAIANRFQSEKDSIDRYFGVAADTTDNHHTDIMLNIGSHTDDALGFAEKVDGCGLFRTEFLYLSKSELPDEEMQFEAYKRTAEMFKGKPLVLRTLDIGGDKQLPGLEIPHEENPFLGLRGIRFCLAHKDIFITQLRAALRASAFGNIKIMFPMVGSLDDIRNAKVVLEQIKEELRVAGTAFNNEIEIGIMVEVPSIALIADEAAKEVSFASIGTNDLCQYLTASDRMNTNVSSYHQEYHPAMFRIIGKVADAFKKQGKKIGICGELAGDPYAAPCLIGLGITSLSMRSGAVAAVKRTITATSYESMRDIAQNVLCCSTEQEVYSLLHR